MAGLSNLTKNSERGVATRVDESQKAVHTNSNLHETNYHDVVAEHLELVNCFK